MKAAVIDDSAGLMRVKWQACVTGDYRIHSRHRTTLMRYFFSVTFAAAPLPFGIVQAATAAAPVFFLGALRGLCARQRCAIGTIDIASIALTTNHHLAMTTQTIVETRAFYHRKKADERWIQAG